MNSKYKLLYPLTDANKPFCYYQAEKNIVLKLLINQMTQDDLQSFLTKLLYFAPQFSQMIKANLNFIVDVNENCNQFQPNVVDVSINSQSMLIVFPNMEKYTHSINIQLIQQIYQYYDHAMNSTFKKQWQQFDMSYKNILYQQTLIIFDFGLHIVQNSNCLSAAPELSQLTYKSGQSESWSFGVLTLGLLIGEQNMKGLKEIKKCKDQSMLDSFVQYQCTQKNIKEDQMQLIMEMLRFNNRIAWYQIELRLKQCLSSNYKNQNAYLNLSMLNSKAQNFARNKILKRSKNQIKENSPIQKVEQGGSINKLSNRTHKQRVMHSLHQKQQQNNSLSDADKNLSHYLFSQFAVRQKVRNKSLQNVSVATQQSSFQYNLSMQNQQTNNIRQQMNTSQLNQSENSVQTFQLEKKMSQDISIWQQEDQNSKREEQTSKSRRDEQKSQRNLQMNGHEMLFSFNIQPSSRKNQETEIKESIEVINNSEAKKEQNIQEIYPKQRNIEQFYVGFNILNQPNFTKDFQHKKERELQVRKPQMTLQQDSSDLLETIQLDEIQEYPQVKQVEDEWLKEQKQKFEKINILGTTVGECITYLEANKNLWIIPLFIIFKRMYFIRLNILEDIKKSNKAEQHEEWIKNVEEENDKIKKEVIQLINQARKRSQKLSVEEKKKIMGHLDLDDGSQVENLAFVYMYTQIYARIKQIIKRVQQGNTVQENKNGVQYQLISWIKLEYQILNSLLLLIDYQTEIDLQNFNRICNSTIDLIKKEIVKIGQQIDEKKIKYQQEGYQL